MKTKRILSVKRLTRLPYFGEFIQNEKDAKQLYYTAVKKKWKKTEIWECK